MRMNLNFSPLFNSTIGLDRCYGRKHHIGEWATHRLIAVRGASNDGRTTVR
jgi:hypothetical protein